MIIAVVGAGVVGVATAHALAERGHDVHVFDAAADVASETSASTAGLIAPGHSYAWASPRAPAMLLRSLFGGATAIRVRPRLDADLLRWGVAFLRECTSTRARANTLAKLRLAQYSQRLQAELTAREDLHYAQTDRGVLYLFRTDAELGRAVQQSMLLRQHGQHQQVLDSRQLVAVEPALRHSDATFAGAIHDMTDATGDPHGFAIGLMRICERHGVQFHLGTRVVGVVTDRGRVTGLSTVNGDMEADAVVLAAGAASSLISRTVGEWLPVYPAKGYTLTAALRDPARGPAGGGIDERSLVAWSRFGEQIRMSGSAEFAGHDRSHSDKDFAQIIAAGNELFPGAIDWTSARHRTGLRPMTPDGPPIIGNGGHPNLYYNTGHGHVGWTMATGSAHLLADLVDGRGPDVDPTPYSPRRFLRRNRKTGHPQRTRSSPG